MLLSDKYLNNPARELSKRIERSTGWDPNVSWEKGDIFGIKIIGYKEIYKGKVLCEIASMGQIKIYQVKLIVYPIDVKSEEFRIDNTKMIVDKDWFRFKKLNQLGIY
jgi:hypothetical protein